MSLLSTKVIYAFGKHYALHEVAYSGAAVSFNVDPGATVAATVNPASGPAATIGSVSNNLLSISLAAGGSSDGGKVVVLTNHGKTVASSKP